jgi:hypothetical protein
MWIICSDCNQLSCLLDMMYNNLLKDQDLLNYFDSGDQNFVTTDDAGNPLVRIVKNEPHNYSVALQPFNIALDMYQTRSAQPLIRLQLLNFETSLARTETEDFTITSVYSLI